MSKKNKVLAVSAPGSLTRPIQSGNSPRDRRSIHDSAWARLVRQAAATPRKNIRQTLDGVRSRGRPGKPATLRRRNSKPADTASSMSVHPKSSSTYLGVSSASRTAA